MMKMRRNDYVRVVKNNFIGIFDSVRAKYTRVSNTSKKIKCKGVMISSYQNYAKKTGLSMDEITLGHELEDAFLLKGLRPGLTLILYNKEKYGPRMKHTLWHEIGHVKCDHKKHSEKEEIEAHFFAAQANAPNVLIKTIAKRGYKIDVRFLMECFGLSEEAAQKKMGYLK